MRPRLFAAERHGSSKRSPALEAQRDGGRRLGDVLRWLGTSGEAPGASGGLAGRTFVYCYATAAIVAGVVTVINIITVRHEQPQFGLAAPIIWEGSSWLTLILFFWIVGLAYRIAPPTVKPRWMLLIHIPAAFLYSFAHVASFVALRKLIYWLAGASYQFGSPVSHFLYEFAKDAFGYALFIASFALVDHLLRQRSPAETPARSATFDIRDGVKLTRVRLSEVLAVASAGNYVEFVLEDGRRLLMRSPLSALESELAPSGFVRTHRSWLVNAEQMTALKPDGSGDYTVELGSIAAPLSRRFPEALAKLRGASA